MACKTSYELNHNFAKLADESGFTFNTHRPRVHIDWDKIRLIDVEGLVRDRKFVLIEQHVNDILDCVLESEFDVRILDEGVVKMFRLAQLTVEYQQFCRHYLDRSVLLLRNQLSNNTQELEGLRKAARDKDEEIRRLKRRPKHTYVPPVLYGNENIANMFLKALSNNGEMFPTTSLMESSHHYNKCSYCEKVFLNQLYLKSHMTRRHPNVTDRPKHSAEDVNESKTTNDGKSLNDEISQLKSKLQDMELTITHFQNEKSKMADSSNLEKTVEVTNVPSTVESVNSNENLLEKIEEWKREEREKYSQEIDAMRSHIIETVNSLKAQEAPKLSQNENNIIQQLRDTIKEQGQQILALNQQISTNNLQAENEKLQKTAEVERQMLQLMEKLEIQTRQYHHMVERMNEASREAQEALAQAEAERIRAATLQRMLDEQARQPEKTNSARSQTHGLSNHTPDISPAVSNQQYQIMKNNRKPKITERKSLEELHQKAKELLNLHSTCSSSDDSSIKHTVEDYPDGNLKLEKSIRPRKATEEVKIANRGKEEKITKDPETVLTKRKLNSEPKLDKKKRSKVKINDIVKEIVPAAPRSPVKVVRAKITEEVNNRLASVGVDPLKNGIPQPDYDKKLIQLQHEQRSKTKKNNSYEKVRHSILAYLDSKSGIETRQEPLNSDRSTPTKMAKPFSLTSVISNVKNKAMSLVKPNEGSRAGRKKLDDVTTRVMAFLKTPPGSPSPSPQHRNSTDSDVPSTPKSSYEKAPKKKITQRAIKTNRQTGKDNKYKKPEIGASPESHVETDATDSDYNYYESKFTAKSSKSLENLMKSPVRRPSTASGDYKAAQIVIDKKHIDITRAQSATNITELTEKVVISSQNNLPQRALSNDNVKTVTTVDSPIRKNASEDNIHASPKQAKGVLKNTPSTSSLNKKKVLFDMDAIQMKSVSASPSQSTEKSDTNERYELGLINLDDEEWDISSIDNEPLKRGDDFKLNVSSRTSPKIAELKNTIEAHLARRDETPSTMRAGSVDVLRAGSVDVLRRGARAPSVGGSNTSLGSSVLDDDAPAQDVRAFVKPRADNDDDSELDLSEFSIDGLANNNKSNKKRESF